MLVLNLRTLTTGSGGGGGCEDETPEASDTLSLKAQLCDAGFLWMKSDFFGVEGTQEPADDGTTHTVLPFLGRWVSLLRSQYKWGGGGGGGGDLNTAQWVGRGLHNTPPFCI